MRYISIFIFIILSQIGNAQNRLSIEAGLDISFFSKPWLYRNTNRTKPGFIIKSLYTAYEKNNFSLGLGFSFKKGSSLNEFYTPWAEPTSITVFPLYNADGELKHKDEFINIQLPIYTGLSKKLNNDVSILVTLENHINILSNSKRSHFVRGNPNSIGERNRNKYFQSFINPGLNISLLFKERYKVGVYAQLNNLPEKHKSIGLLVGILL